MKTMKKTMSLFLLLALLVSSLTGCFRIPANYQETSMTTSQEVTTYETHEKIYCNATLEDDFRPDGIIILLQPAFNTKEYTVDDFPEIDCTAVREIYRVKEGVLGRMLFLTLAEQTKPNVLVAIHKLESRDDICCIEPNYLIPLEAAPNDEKYESTEQ